MARSIDRMDLPAVNLEPLERRVGVLRVSAYTTSSTQTDVMCRYRRGWVGVMTKIDNLVRREVGLPTYEQTNSPVKAYVEFVNGEEGALNELLAKAGEQFGSGSLQALRAHIQEHLEAEGGGRLKYVPPSGYTYVVFRLDDVFTRDLPLS